MGRIYRLLFSSLLILATPLVSVVQSEDTVLKLNQLIEEALRENPEILASEKKLEVFKEKIRQAGALEDPMLGLGIVSLPTDLSFRDEDMTMKELSISQRFPFPGKRALMRKMAEKEADAVSLEKQGKANRVVKDVKTVYYDLSHLYRAKEVTERNKGILENLVKIAKARYEVGEGIHQDVLKGHIEVSKMVDELIMLDQRITALNAKLRALLNWPLHFAVGKPEEVVFETTIINVEGLQQAAVESNPALKGMRKMIEAKEKEYALAKLEYYPDFGVRFAYGQRDDSPEGGRRDLLTGMMEINIPIFYRSKQSRKAAEALAEIQAAEARYRAMRNEIFFMISDSASMLQRLENQLELYKTGIIPQVGLQVNSAISAYTVNKVNFMTLVDSQMTLYRYELEYHQALTEYEKKLATLELVVGKRFR